MSIDRPLLLSGYAAKQCARRVHNEWDPTIDAVRVDAPPELQMLFDAGHAFEADVFGRILDILGPARCTDLSDVHGREQLIDATSAAMDAGVEVILGGWLPDDLTGGRVGKPDVLLRYGDPRENVYVPGDVKGHKTVNRRATKTLRFSRVQSPSTVLEIDGLAPQVSNRFDDFMQLAHYWRMLEACHRFPSGETPKGFIIGTDDLVELDSSGLVLVWHDLAANHFETYSRSLGRKKRSALERYDHEHGFRLKIATVARSRTGSVGDPPPVVQPIFNKECDSCPWHEYCLDVAGPSASARIRFGGLSVREWKALDGLGVTTVEDLAMLEVDEPVFQSRYLPEVTDQKDVLGRLSLAVRRARMIRSGSTLERETTGRVDVPRGDVEVDFDIESDPEGRVYLWGLLVQVGVGSPTYYPVVSWDLMDDRSEFRLAKEFATYLRDLIEAAESRGDEILVFHYSHVEISALNRILGADEVADLTSHFVDLLPIVRKHFFGLDGLGIKKVAPAFGFRWRDDDPGGLQSQVWLEEARGDTNEDSTVEARTRMLEYNEDDVLATATIRAGLE